MDCIFPSKLKAGLTFTQLVTLEAWPAPVWALSAFLRGPASIDLTATAEGELHRWQVDAATSAGWSAGLYEYSARVSGPTGVFEVDSGQVEIAADLAGITGAHDGRSHARRVLDAIEAVLEGRAAKDQERYVIEFNGSRRELWRTPLADLMALRTHYRTQVRNEERKARGKSPIGAWRVRF